MNEPTIIAAIITSSFAFLAAIISIFISYRNLKLQKKLANASLQSEYLNRKIKILEDEKNKLLSLGAEEANYKDEKAFWEAYSKYANVTAHALPNILNRIYPYVTGNVDNIYNDMEEVNKYIDYLRAKKLFKNDVKEENGFNKFQNTNPIDQIFTCKDNLLEIINKEIKESVIKIEALIELNPHNE